MDTMQLKMKREEAKKALAIFYLKCKNKHEKNECPLDTVEFYGIPCDKHPYDKCPFLPPLQCVLMGKAHVEIGEPHFL